MPSLFDPLRLGDLDLPNRILMAPLTRCRASAGRVPNELMARYYAQRAKQGKEKAPTDWAEIDAQCAEMLSRHRINATPAPGSIASSRRARSRSAASPNVRGSSTAPTRTPR